MRFCERICPIYRKVFTVQIIRYREFFRRFEIVVLILVVRGRGYVVFTFGALLPVVVRVHNFPFFGPSSVVVIVVSVVIHYCVVLFLASVFDQFVGRTKHGIVRTSTSTSFSVSVSISVSAPIPSPFPTSVPSPLPTSISPTTVSTSTSVS